MRSTNQAPSEGGEKRWGVVLLAHGAPEQLGEIPEFLLSVRGGQPLPEGTVQEIVRRYALIGGGSPLRRVTMRQAEALAKVLGMPVYVGMRNWKPSIVEAMRRVNEDGVNHVVALCLAPQNSRISIELYRKHLEDAVEKVVPALRVEFVESWHDHPQLIVAWREKVSAGLASAEAEAGKQVPVIFTAHSVPERTIAEGDPYENQVRETASLVAAAIGLKDYRIAFQSQGMTAGPWIGPTVASEIDQLAAEGHRHVLVAPVGFVSDHLEILYDIDIVFRDYGKAKGVSVLRTEALNDSPLLIQALASIVSSRMSQASHAGGPH